MRLVRQRCLDLGAASRCSGNNLGAVKLSPPRSETRRRDCGEMDGPRSRDDSYAGCTKRVKATNQVEAWQYVAAVVTHHEFVIGTN